MPIVERNTIGKQATSWIALLLCQQQPTMKKLHDDDYSKQERKLLLLVAASMIQAYAGVFGAVIYQQIATTPASPEFLLVVASKCWHPVKWFSEFKAYCSTCRHIDG